MIMKDVKILDIKWFCGSIGVVKIELPMKGVQYKIGYTDSADVGSMIDEIVEFGETFPVDAGRVLFGD